MKKTTIRNSLFAVITLLALAGCTAKCNCPVCPVANQAQPQTTIIHEPE